ncbi:LOW QUALITY PROTEIN: M-phase phosphoprotein 9 [Rhinatrema bivittatum]|uniref:LOW QUALITY PROTEIN: M-phase phosphoprotein 9 n=1 Tax=Rhinatrema bivittatum TaxID=194408 RepID=UPI0011281E21|nr:LOW QUALITY PROTEIN: M-phase phosphoprotein 9 [Rhinatrema bivittatum]
MEDSNSVKSTEDSSPYPAELDLGVTENVAECISRSGGISQFSTNEVSFLSGKTSSSVTPSSAEVLTTFMQDMYNSGRTNSEIWKSCEARWLQLFKLVEKQCQDQIVAQQEQFHNQIQLIQDEIKHLVTLQIGNTPRNSGTGQSSSKWTNNSSALEMQADQHSEAFEDNGRNPSQLKSCSEVEKQPKTCIIQESFVDTTSISSGYNTISATEPHPNQVNCDHSVAKQSMGCTQSTVSELTGIPLIQKTSALAENARKCIPGNEGNCLTCKLMNYTISMFLSGNSRRLPAKKIRSIKIMVEKCSSNKPLISWAQKQSQMKKAKLVEESCTASMQENKQTEKLELDNLDCTDASPPYTFYLRRTSDSPASEASGFTYWKLDERELYHPLPDQFENVFSNHQFTKITTKQPNSADNRLPSSLRIFIKETKRKQPADDWTSPSQSYHHPPEVLTLDPTLHQEAKPAESRTSSFSSYYSGTRSPITPDSLLKPLSDSHSDMESFTHSNTDSPRLDDLPSCYTKSQVLHLNPWNNHAFQNQTNASNDFSMQFSESGTATVNQSDDEENSLTVSPSLMAHSELLCVDCSLPEYSTALTSLEHPLMLSRIRQNLREKHARHIADLRDYYEAEIHHLKQQLSTNMLSASEELQKTNQTLLERCGQLEGALTEASMRMQSLENKNSFLELQVKDWRERFNTVSNTSKVLQERIEEMRTANKEKENTISRLKSKLKDLEEALEHSCKLSDDKDDRIKQECKMFQDLLVEYESLGKEHERVKDTLNIAENKLLDANSEISEELKRMVSKLETQVKQVEHENLTRLRHIAEGHLWTSSSKTFPHPEGSQSPSKLRTADVARRKWLIPGTDCSIFTGQPLESQDHAMDNRLQDDHVPNRYHTPPEKDSFCKSFSRNEMKNKEKAMPDTPIMKALKELEGKKVFKNWGTQTEKEDTSNKLLNRRNMVGFVESACSTSEVLEKRRDQKPKRLNSSNGQRSSSLPPSSRKSTPTATPTKREIMLTPISVKHSPKRSPKENFSPGFNQLLSKEESTVTRFDVLLDDLKTSPTFQGPSPRKRLQFLSLDDLGDHQYSNHAIDKSCSASDPAPLGMKNQSPTSGPALEDPSAAATHGQYIPVPLTPYETELSYRTRLKTLAETEKVFDELIQEKQQIEAALSRMPCVGGRLTLQTRLNREALEDRLERINRNLGSIRMTLKKFHVLRTSANP